MSNATVERTIDSKRGTHNVENPMQGIQQKPIKFGVGYTTYIISCSDPDITGQDNG